jgi:hypothetical protein
LLRLDSAGQGDMRASHPRLVFAPALLQDEIDGLDRRRHRQRFDPEDRQAGGEMSTSGAE